MNVCKNLKMESKELLKSDIRNRASYYFDDIVKDIDINLGNILLDEK